MAIKILVADDATFVRDMIKRTLRHMALGFEIFEAPDGARAKTIIKQHRPDLILSDWEMPSMSGEELLTWLRETPDTAKTPFIMVTSRGDRDHVMAAVKAGVNDYISKPFTAEELTRKVMKQLKKLNVSLKPQSGLSSESTAFSSLGVLTGGTAKSSPPSANVSPAVKKDAPLNTSTSSLKGKAVLRFAGSEPQDYLIREASLQSVGGFLVRSEHTPTVFDQAVVDVADDEGNLIVTLNGYVHSVTAAEAHAKSRGIKVVIRFVDQDPQKLDALSKHLQA